MSGDTAVGLDQPQTAGEQLSFTARSGQTYTFTKYVGVVTSRDSSSPASDARKASQGAASLGQSTLRSENANAWAAVWKNGISVTGDDSLQTAINANTYDLYASISSDSPDAIGPSGLSSDGYAGMVFWDSDIWMFPAILATHPDVARAAVDYRFNTLQAAEHDAAANGYQGAFYPWTAGDDGYTGCRLLRHDDRLERQDHLGSELQLQRGASSSGRHRDGAVGVLRGHRGQRTGCSQHGWPVLQALAEFWVSKAVPDPRRRLRHQPGPAAGRVPHRGQQLRVHERRRRHRSARCRPGSARGRRHAASESGPRSPTGSRRQCRSTRPEHLRRIRRLQRRADQAGGRGHADVSDRLSNGQRSRPQRPELLRAAHRPARARR